MCSREVAEGDYVLVNLGVSIDVYKHDVKGDASAPSVARVLRLFGNYVALEFFWSLGQIHAECDLRPDWKYRSLLFRQKNLCQDGKYYVQDPNIPVNSRDRYTEVLPKEVLVGHCDVLYKHDMPETDFLAFEKSAFVGDRRERFWWYLEYDHTRYEFTVPSDIPLGRCYTQYPPHMVDLYAGLGTVSLAASSAGCQPICCVDQDPDASNTTNSTFRRFTQRPDIHTRTVEQFLDDVDCGKINLGQVDWLHASPPCNNLSHNNRHNRSDVPAMCEFRQIDRAVQLLKPAYITVEEVEAMVVFKEKGGSQGKQKDDKKTDDNSPACETSDPGTSSQAQGGYQSNPFLLITLFLLQQGYQLRLDMLQASHYGVPQRRWRPFIVAAREGYSLPQWPSGRYRPTERLNMIRALMDNRFHASHWEHICVTPPTNEGPLEVTVGEAFGDYRMEVDDFKESDYDPRNGWRLGPGKTVSKFAQFMLMPHVPDEQHISYVEQCTRNLLWHCTYKNDSALKRIVDWKDEKEIDKAFLKADAVAPAVVMMIKQIPKAELHPQHWRLLTPAERQRLQSIPNWVNFSSCKNSETVMRQVGNAVPYLMAWEVAACVCEAATGVNAPRPPLLKGYGTLSWEAPPRPAPKPCVGNPPEWPTIPVPEVQIPISAPEKSKAGCKMLIKKHAVQTQVSRPGMKCQKSVLLSQSVTKVDNALAPVHRQPEEGVQLSSMSPLLLLANTQRKQQEIQARRTKYSQDEELQQLRWGGDMNPGKGSVAGQQRLKVKHSEFNPPVYLQKPHMTCREACLTAHMQETTHKMSGRLPHTVELWPQGSFLDPPPRAHPLQCVPCDLIPSKADKQPLLGYCTANGTTPRSAAQPPYFSQRPGVDQEGWEAPASRQRPGIRRPAFEDCYEEYEEYEEEEMMPSGFGFSEDLRAMDFEDGPVTLDPENLLPGDSDLEARPLSDSFTIRGSKRPYGVMINGAMQASLAARSGYHAYADVVEDELEEAQVPAKAMKRAAYAAPQELRVHAHGTNDSAPSGERRRRVIGAQLRDGQRQSVRAAVRSSQTSSRLRVQDTLHSPLQTAYLTRSLAVSKPVTAAATPVKARALVIDRPQPPKLVFEHALPEPSSSQSTASEEMEVQRTSRQRKLRGGSVAIQKPGSVRRPRARPASDQILPVPLRSERTAPNLDFEYSDDEDVDKLLPSYMRGPRKEQQADSGSNAPLAPITSGLQEAPSSPIVLSSDNEEQQAGRAEACNEIPQGYTSHPLRPRLATAAVQGEGNWLIGKSPTPALAFTGVIAQEQQQWDQGAEVLNRFESRLVHNEGIPDDGNDTLFHNGKPAMHAFCKVEETACRQYSLLEGSLADNRQAAALVFDPPLGKQQLCTRYTTVQQEELPLAGPLNVHKQRAQDGTYQNVERRVQSASTPKHSPVPANSPLGINLDRLRSWGPGKRTDGLPSTSSIGSSPPHRPLARVTEPLVDSGPTHLGEQAGDAKLRVGHAKESRLQGATCCSYVDAERRLSGSTNLTGSPEVEKHCVQDKLILGSPDNPILLD